MKLRSSRRAILALLALGAAAAGQSVDGPVLGYVFDAARGGIRPVLGIPGAATVAEPLDLGVALVWAEVSPAQDHALAVAAESGEVLMIRLDGPARIAGTVPGAPPAPQRIAFSPRGGAAALFYRDTVRLLAGLPDAPAESAEWDLTTLGGAISALAVSDDAAAVAVAACEDGACAVYELAPAEGPRRLTRLGYVSAIRFLPGSRDVLIADHTNDQLVLIRGGEAMILAGPGEGISLPTAVAAAADGRAAFVANAGTATVTAIDLEGGGMSQLGCACRPTLLEPFRGNAVFRLSEASGGPVYVLDAAMQAPRIVFVPPAPDAAETVVVAPPLVPRSRGRP